MYFNTRLLARSHYASGRSCDRPTRSICSVAILCPRAKTQSGPQIHVAPHISQAAVPGLYQHFVTMLPSAQTPIVAYCQHSTSQSLTLQASFRRRTSGYSLGNFREVNFLFVPLLPRFSISVAIFKASGITSAHCHSAARRKTTPDAANCYAERHHSHGTCCVYSAETTTLHNYHSSNTTKNASRLQTAVSVSIRIPTIHTSADAARTDRQADGSHIVSENNTDVTSAK